MGCVGRQSYALLAQKNRNFGPLLGFATFEASPRGRGDSLWLTRLSDVQLHKLIQMKVRQRFRSQATLSIDWPS